MKLHHLLSVTLCSVALFFNVSALAQEETEDVATAAFPAAVDKGPEDALNRGNPRSSIAGFLTAASEFNWERSAEYLDLRDLPPEIAAIGGNELARQLNHVLSRSVWLDDYSVSDNPEGQKGDGLPSFRDELVKINTREDVITLWMQKVPRGDGVNIWKVSNRSVALVPELYQEFSYSAPVEKIRGWFPDDASFLGVEAFKWFILIALALVCWPAFRLLGIILSRLLSSPTKEVYPLVRSLFTGPLVFIAILVTVGTTLEQLGAGAYAQKVMKANTLPILAVVWGLWAAINLFRSYQQEKLFEKGRPGAAKLLQPLTTLLKLLVLIFGSLFWLSNLGINITTLLAGLGVGGLAVALALQKPIEDMMGALSIFTQASIRVGDLCRYGQEVGVVEDIGLRTTRLRTLTNTVVSIPNARIASVEVENLSYRTKIRYAPTLRLRYDTSPGQIRQINGAITNMLLSDSRVYDEPARVRFRDFAEDAILIEIYSFIRTTDFTEFLEIAEELNIGIMEIVQEAGAQFALPGRALHLEGGAQAASI